MQMHERELPVTRATSEIKYLFVKKELSYLEQRIVLTTALHLTNLLMESDLVIPESANCAQDACGSNVYLVPHVEDLISKSGAAGLTHGEFQSMIGDLLMSSAKYMVRFERHGNYDTPGGLT